MRSVSRPADVSIKPSPSCRWMPRGVEAIGFQLVYDQIDRLRQMAEFDAQHVIGRLTAAGHHVT
jgi:hypothetical protein